MNSCELVNIILTLTCIIAKDKTIDELSILATIFTQLGDMLATIATATINPKNSNK